MFVPIRRGTAVSCSSLTTTALPFSSCPVTTRLTCNVMANLLTQRLTGLLDRLQVADELCGALDNVLREHSSRFGARKRCVARHDSIPRVIGDVHGRVHLEPLEVDRLQARRFQTDQLAVVLGSSSEIAAV